MLGIVFPMLLSGNEKKEGKGRKTVFESPEKEMLAHRVLTKYSLGHLICIAILCVYNIHMWTRSICVVPFHILTIHTTIYYMDREI